MFLEILDINTKEQILLTRYVERPVLRYSPSEFDRINISGVTYIYRTRQLFYDRDNEGKLKLIGVRFLVSPFSE